MIKNFLITIVFLVQSVASAAPILQLKGYTVNSLSETSIEVVYKGEKVVIEKTGLQKFNMNGQPLSFTNSDTLDQVHLKIQNAYKAGKKRSASLDELFMSKAHAIEPLFAGLVGGIFGFAIGDGMCKNRGRASGEEPAPTVVN